MTERPDLAKMRAELSIDGGIRPGQTRGISGAWRQRVLDLCDHVESLERALAAAERQIDEYAEWVGEAIKQLPDWMLPVGHAEVSAALTEDRLHEYFATLAAGGGE